MPSGAILVSGNDVNYVDENPADVITVDCYAGSDGRFMFYEDDGTSNAYKNGVFSVIPISFSENEHGFAITIGLRMGSYKVADRRKFIIRYHMPDRVVETEMDYTDCRVARNYVGVR
mgnify:CR=1 FL=1